MAKLSALLVIGLMFVIPSSQASATVQYKNQKPGQFCKSVDVGKYVTVPGSGKLKCVLKSGATRAKWVHS